MYAAVFNGLPMPPPPAMMMGPLMPLMGPPVFLGAPTDFGAGPPSARPPRAPMGSKEAPPGLWPAAAAPSSPALAWMDSVRSPQAAASGDPAAASRLNEDGTTRRAGVSSGALSAAARSFVPEAGAWPTEWPHEAAAVEAVEVDSADGSGGSVNGPEDLGGLLTLAASYTPAHTPPSGQERSRGTENEGSAGLREMLRRHRALMERVQPPRPRMDGRTMAEVFAGLDSSLWVLPTDGVTFEGVLHNSMRGLEEFRLSSRTEGEALLSAVSKNSRVDKLEHCMDEVCPICQENLELGESVRTLPCFHRLHDSCSAQYYKHKARTAMFADCPICREPVKLWSP